MTLLVIPSKSCLYVELEVKKITYKFISAQLYSQAQDLLGDTHTQHFLMYNMHMYTFNFMY